MPTLPLRRYRADWIDVTVKAHTAPNAFVFDFAFSLVGAADLAAISGKECRRVVSLGFLIDSEVLTGASAHVQDFVHHTEALRDHVETGQRVSIGGGFQMRPDHAGWAPLFIEMETTSGSPQLASVIGEAIVRTPPLFSSSEVEVVVSRLLSLLD